MEAATFYTWGAEASKFVLYVIYLAMIGFGLWQRWQKNPNWAGWIHAVVFLNFIIGGLYGGARMLTTDPVNDMLIRRMFAWEAYFCFACASFYFLALYLVKRSRVSKNE